MTESLVKSKPYLLPLAVLQPIGIGSLAAAGFADHRYAGATDAIVADGFFFRPEAAGAVSSDLETP